MEIVVKQEDERLDKYLAANTEYTRSIISKMLDEGYITVNGKKEKASYKVREDDIIIVKDGYVTVPDIEAVKMDIDIVYEDDDLMLLINRVV